MADNSHAESRILARCIRSYDSERKHGAVEHAARDHAVAHLANLARLDYWTAAELLADALAHRAERKLNLEG